MCLKTVILKALIFLTQAPVAGNTITCMCTANIYTNPPPDSTDSEMQEIMQQLSNTTEYIRIIHLSAFSSVWLTLKTVLLHRTEDSLFAVNNIYIYFLHSNEQKVVFYFDSEVFSVLIFQNFLSVFLYSYYHFPIPCKSSF